MEKRKPGLPLDDGLLAGVGGGAGITDSCGLTEAQFPKQGQCLLENRSTFGPVYTQVCPHCSIFTSVPEGESLTVAHIFECSLYGYVNRLTE